MHGEPSTDPIQIAAREILYRYAVTRSEKFRQWLYPGLPDSDVTNPELDRLIEWGASKGKTAQEIADEIYRARAQ